MAGSITSTSAILMLTIPNLYPIPQQLQNFSVDDIYDIDDIETVETQMGVDGHLAGGLVLNKVMQRISLKADSASCLIFENWWQSQIQIGDVYIASMTTTLTSVGRQYVQTGGFLSRIAPAPSARKVLQQRRFELTWESVVPVPTGATPF